MDAMQAMLTRKSVKKYKPQPVEKELVDKIIEAGLNAPSGLNKQSPIILAVTNKELRDELSRLNAGDDPFFRADPFYGAPVVLVVLADKKVPTHVYDGSLVMGNLMNAATSLGLGSCWIHRAREMFDSAEGKALLRKWGLPENLRGIGNCVLGYADGEPMRKPRQDGRILKVE